MRSDHARVRAVVLAALLCALPGCASTGSLGKPETADFLNAYTSAVASGDSTRVKDFWSPRALGRDGFWTMHLGVGALMPFPALSDTVRGLRFEIGDIRHEAGFDVVSGDWVATDADTGATRIPTRFYLVRERGRLRLLKPIDALTADWQTRETSLFRFHVPPGVRAADHAAEMERLTREVETIARQLEIESPGKMDYYVTPDQEACGALMLQRPSNGYASLAHGLIVSVTFDNVHEAVHLLAHRGGVAPGNEPLSEGLAVAFGGNTRTVAALAPMQTLRFLADGRYVPLDELFRDREAFFRRNYVTYFEAGAFVRFLFETYGAQRLETLLRAAHGSSDVATLLATTFDRPLPELERAFHAWLAEHPPAVLGTEVPPDAARVFAMDDPTGDDYGDGDYAYPNDRFTPGVFDLTGFEVLADSSRAVFRITLAAPAPPVAYLPGGERFASGVVIAIDRQRGDRLVPDCFGVTLGKDRGWDLAINAGVHVSLVNPDRKVFWSSVAPLPRPETGDGTLVFSLPVALIGRPEPDWRYFVGTGLVSDRTMDFLFAGPIPVMKTSRVLIGGGNTGRGDPVFMDVLLDPAADQARVLGDYDPDTGRRPVVPMVGASAGKASRP